MRIAIVTQYYTPEPVRIPDAVARSLVARGHDVRVITGYPNYPEGKLYQGYRQKWRHIEHIDGVTVRRTPLIISHSYNAFARFSNYLTFAFSSLCAGPFVRNADVIYVYATQMTAAIAPQVWRLTRGTPFVLHIMDLWPESVIGSSMVPGKFRKKIIGTVLGFWLSALYQQSSSVIATAPTMSRMLNERGVPKDKLRTVLNWAEERIEESPARESPSEGRGLRVVYAGNIGDMQDLDTVLMAALLVSDLSGFQIIFVGAGVAEQRLKKTAGEYGLRNVEFRGRVDPLEMSDIYAESDFQLVTLRDLPVFRGTIPSKLQGSLSNGVPVITNVPGDVTSIVRESGVGLTASPENPDELAAAFREAYSMSDTSRRQMGKRARELYVRTMSAKVGIDIIESVLKSAANQ